MESGPSSVSGAVENTAADLQGDLTGKLQEFEVGAHRFCTECVVEGENIDRLAVMARMESLDASSLVVAGGRKRVRVHIHVNNPAEVFLACEEFGRIKQQKADDMERQRGLLDHSGEVAIVTDSGGDIPPDEVERLGIHVVPVRLSFGDREYLDGVSLSAEEFYRLLSESEEAAADFATAGPGFCPCLFAADIPRIPRHLDRAFRPAQRHHFRRPASGKPSRIR